jgi:hypothetical protein
MRDHTSSIPRAFHRLRRALITRRLLSLDPVLRLELALIAVLMAAVAGWWARLPLDHVARVGGACAVLGRLVAGPGTLRGGRRPADDAAPRAAPAREPCGTRFDPAAALAAEQELRETAARGGATLFASHVVETLERLCDRVLILHLGRVVRTIPRAAWGGPEHGPSPLEREFLSVVPSFPQPEPSA